MAYLLGLGQQQTQVWVTKELAVSVQGVPALQSHYVLLDKSTKRPVPGQQIRRKGQALEIWVDGQLVLVLPAFFASSHGAEIFDNLDHASLDGVLSADQLTNLEKHTDQHWLSEEAWDIEHTFALSELAVSPTSWRESDLRAQVNVLESGSNVTMTDTASGTANVTTSGAVSTTVTGSVSSMGLGAVGLLLGMSAISSHVNNKVSVVPSSGGGSGGGAGGGTGGGTGGGSGGGSQTVTSNGSGAFTAGPAVAGNGLHMKVYRADTGALLEDVKVADDGTYAFTTSYVGVVILVIQDVDADPNNPGMDYMDEAGGLVDLSVELRSISVLGAAGGAETANVTPMTEIAATIATGKSAAQAAAAGYAETTLTPTAVANTNKAVAKVLGLGDNVDVTSAVVTPITDANGNLNAGMNDYGRVLAALSHAGDLSNAIATMAAGIRVDASGNPSFNADAGSAAQVLMAQGMAEAETAQGISFSSIPALQTVKAAATKAYSSVLIANMLKADGLLGTDQTTALNAAKTALQNQTTDGDTLSNAWVNNSSLNANLAFFETLNTNKGSFDNAMGLAFNKALDQAKLAKQLLDNTQLSAATLARAQASYDQALAGLKQQAQTALDRIELQGLKQADMAADWADGQTAALTRLGVSLAQLSTQLSADKFTAQAWQQSITQLTAAQKNLNTVQGASKPIASELLSAQSNLAAAKLSVSQAESTTADQALSDLAAWKLIAMRRQAYVQNPNTQTESAWKEALHTEATQVQGDQLASQALAAALDANNKSAIRAAMLTAYNRAATDRVFADALSQALDDGRGSDIDVLQQYAAAKAEVDKLLSEAWVAKQSAGSNAQAQVLENLLAAQAASEKLAAQAWGKAGSDTGSPVFDALAAKNATNKVLVDLLLDTFVKQDQAQADLLIDANDADALKRLKRSEDIVDSVVKSFNQEALYQVQVAMNKVLRIDERPDASSNIMAFDASNLPQEVVTLGIPEVSGLTWSLVNDANHPDASKFSLSTSGELQFTQAPDYETSLQKTFSVLVKMQDAQGHFVTQVITVHMGNVNEAPTKVGTLVPQTLAKGRSFSLDVSSAFADVDANDSLSFSAEGLPEGLTIKPDGQIVGNPSKLQTPTTVTITATDAGGLSVSQSFDMKVLDAPSIQSVTPALNSKPLVKAGDTVQLVVTTTEALSLGGNGTPVLEVNFNGHDLLATFVKLEGQAVTFSFTAPPMLDKQGDLLAQDGNAMRVTGLSLNGSTLTGATSGLSFESSVLTPLTTNTIRLDNTAPVAPGLRLDDKGYDNTDGLSVATTVMLSGIESDATWEFSLDSGTTWKAGALLPREGGPGFALSDEQTYTAGSIQVRQTDAVGNVSMTNSSPKDWAIDNTPPTVSLSSATTKMNALDGSATLTLKFSEVPGNLPIVTSTAGSVSAWSQGSNNKTYTATFTPFQNLETKALFNLGAWYDQAGNLGSTTTSISIDIDTKPPSAPSMTLTDTGRSSSDGVTFNAYIAVGQLEAGAIWEYSLDGGAQWLPGTGSSFALAEGAYARGRVQMRQTDAAGNTSQATPFNAAWLVDTTAPTTLVNSLTNDNVLNFFEREGGVAVSGVSSGAQVGDQVLVRWNGSSLTTSVQADGSWAVGFARDQLPVGELQSDITITITDLAGNSSSTLFSVGVDTVAPFLALPVATMPSDLNGWAVNVNEAVVDNILNLFELTAINSGATWSLSGLTTAEAGQSITLELDGRIFKGSVIAGGSDSKNTWTVTDNADGNDVASVLKGLVHGNTYKLKVQGQDAAGNLSAWNESFLVVKLYPPDVPTVAVLKTNSLTPLISGKALKDTNQVDEYGAKIYSSLEDDDSLKVTVANQEFDLNLFAGQDSNGPLSYNRNTQEWQLDLGSYKNSNGVVIPLVTPGVLNIKVQVSAVGYAQPIQDQSSNEVLVNTTAPTITWDNVALDNRLNAIETLSAVTLSGQIVDKVSGSDVNWAVGQVLAVSMSMNGQTKVWQTTVNADGEWSVQLTATQAQALAQGNATFTASMVSVFGNSASQNHIFTVDTVAPNLILTTPADVNLSVNETKSWATAIQVSDSPSGLDTIQVSVLNGGVPLKTSPVILNTAGNQLNGDLSKLTDGEYTVQVVAKDLAGNTSVQSLQLSIDQTAPTVSWSLSSTRLGQNQTTVVTMTLSEAVTRLPMLKPSVGQMSAWEPVADSSGLQYKAIFTPPSNSGGKVIWSLDAWADKAGNEGSLNTLPGSIDFDTLAPTVQSFAFINPLNKPLKASDSVDIEVQFSEALTVIGSPGLSLQVGAQTRSAQYVGAKTGDASVLVWRYTVQAGDNDADGISIGANALNLGSNGSIRDAFGNQAVLNHAAPLGLVPVLVDTTAPTVILSLMGDDTHLALGETATLQIKFSEKPASLPTLSASLGSLGSWTQINDISYNLVFIPNPKVSNGDVLFSLADWTDAAGNAGNKGTLALANNKTLRVDTVAPIVTSVTDQITSVTNADISFEVSLSEAISGNWSTSSFMASNGTVKSVTPIAGNKLTVVVTPKTNTEADVALSLVAGTLKDAAGNALVNQDLSSLNSQAIDTKLPSVSSVLMMGNSTTGLYKAGDEIIVKVQMTEAVTVTGVPQVALDMGGSRNRQARYISGTGSDTLLFSYTVQPYTVQLNDNDADGVAVSVNALNLPASSALKDAAGNAATLSHAGLAANSLFKVDTVLPQVAISSDKTQLPAGASANLTFIFSEDPGNSFTYQDVFVVGGTLSSLTGSGLTRSAIFTLSPTFNGEASVAVANAVFSDDAGNQNADGAEANNQISWWADSNAPTSRSAQVPSTTLEQWMCKATRSVRCFWCAKTWRFMPKSMASWWAMWPTSRGQLLTSGTRWISAPPVKTLRCP